MKVNSQIGPFSLVPEWVIQRDLSPTALKLYVVLARFADWSTGEAFPARETLAERMGCSPKTVDRAVKELEEAECIRSWQISRYASKRYQVFQVDPRSQFEPFEQTDLTPDGTDMTGEGTNMSGREDTDVHLTRTNEREPKNDNHLTKKPQPKTADDYEPSDAIKADFEERYPGLRLDIELEKFRDHHMAKGSRFDNWDRAMRKWLRQASEWSKEARAARASMSTDLEWDQWKKENGYA